jgi:hypothetical protein
VDLLGIQLLGQRCKSGRIRKEHGHLLTLALDGAFMGQDFFNQELGRIGLKMGEFLGGRTRALLQIATAFITVSGAVWIISSTLQAFHFSCPMKMNNQAVD